MLEGMRSAIQAGHDVIADNCHLTPSLPRTYRKEFAREGVVFVVRDFTNIDIEECKRRDSQREVPVGPEVIDRLAKSHEKARKNGWRLTDKWMNPEPYVKPVPVQHIKGLLPAIICDIDGTIADHEGNRSPYDYTRVAGDKPRQNIVDIVRLFQIVGQDTVLFVSGRDSSCRNDTLTWLEDQGLRPTHLYMRPEGDDRPDYIIKHEIFDKEIRGQFNVRFVLDDRDQVVRLWRDLGLDCLQVAEGAF